MNVPDNLRYTKDHEWVKIEEGMMIVGITDYAQDQLGDIVYVDVDTVGEEVDANEPFGSVEAVKTVSELFMPVSGTVEELNEAIEEDPELVNKDPYGEGWMIKISGFSTEEVEGLLDAAGYEKLISAEA